MNDCSSKACSGSYNKVSAYLLVASTVFGTLALLLGWPQDLTAIADAHQVSRYPMETAMHLIGRQSPFGVQAPRESSYICGRSIRNNQLYYKM